MSPQKSSERANASRAREFDHIFGCLDQPQSLMDAIHNDPASVDLELEGIQFECGNVTRLISDIQLRTATWPYPWRPIYISHIDSVPAARKKKIESKFSLPIGSLSSPQRKADLLFIDERNEPYFISFKDTDQVCKLGQVSKGSYSKTSISGGHLVELPDGLAPDDVLWTDTLIPEDKFEKLGTRDRQYAYLKKNRPAEWKRIHEVSLEVAYAELARFGLTLELDRSTMIEFLWKTLAGNLRESPNFYLALGAQIINFKDLMSRLAVSDLTVTSKMVETKSKRALVIEVSMNDKDYVLTRIEPSFEGSSPTIEQTKGVIYHFQQFPRTGNHWVQLFLYVMQ